MLLPSNSTLAIADGRNFLELNKFRSHEEVYTSSGVASVEVIDKIEQTGYLVELSTGQSFISATKDFDIYPFYTYMRPFSGLSTRYINSTYDIWKTQRFMIYNHANNSEECVIPIDLDIENLDSLSNLKAVSKSEYLSFINKQNKARSGIQFFNSRINSQLTGYTAGCQNGNFSGLTNSELVDLCKKYYAENSNFKNIRQLLKKLQELGENIPKSFSKYRFGGNSYGYTVLQEIVFNDLPYTAESENLLSQVIIDEMKKDRERINFLKNYKPKIMSITDIGLTEFYDVRGSTDVAIILSSNDSFSFNSEGVYYG